MISLHALQRPQPAGQWLWADITGPTGMHYVLRPQPKGRAPTHDGCRPNKADCAGPFCTYDYRSIEPTKTACGYTTQQVAAEQSGHYNCESCIVHGAPPE